MSNSKAAKSAPALRAIHATGNPKAATIEELQGVIETMRVARKNGLDLSVQLHVGVTTIDLTNAANQEAAAATVPADGKERARFVNLDATGKPTAGEHVAVYDRSTGLVWSRALVGSNLTHTEALKAAAAFKLFGKPCRAPTLPERFSISDYGKHSPALDTAHFKKEEGWEWTSTLDASSPADFAWGVALGSGYCNRYGQCFRGGVRAVLAGQNLTFDF